MALLEPYRAGLSQWAKTEPLVKTVYIFGSFAKGTADTNSDLDVAVELTISGDDALATWISNRATWTRNLEGILGCTVDLQWCDPQETPRVFEYVQEASVLVYEKT